MLHNKNLFEENKTSVQGAKSTLASDLSWRFQLFRSNSCWKWNTKHYGEALVLEHLPIMIKSRVWCPVEKKNIQSSTLYKHESENHGRHKQSEFCPCSGLSLLAFLNARADHCLDNILNFTNSWQSFLFQSIKVHLKMRPVIPWICWNIEDIMRQLK